MASRRPRVKVAANLSIRRAPKAAGTGAEQLKAPGEGETDETPAFEKDTSLEGEAKAVATDVHLENVPPKAAPTIPQQDKQQDEQQFKLPKPVDDVPKYSSFTGAGTEPSNIVGSYGNTSTSNIINQNNNNNNNNNTVEEPMSPRKQEARFGFTLPLSRKRNRTESLTSNKSLPEGVSVNKVARKLATKQEESQRTLENKKEIRKRLTNIDQVSKQNLTMFDMIYYNPTNNPMETASPTLSKRGSLESIPKAIDGRRSRSVSKSRSPTPAPAAASAAVPKQPTVQLTPQLKLGPNGEMILDEASLVIENEREKEIRDALASTDIVYQDEFSGNSGYYSRLRRTKDWSNEETIRFYRCLHTIGTDFSMMLTLFPCRTRRDLKLKFKKEERLNLNLVNKALQHPKEFKLEELRQQFAQEDEELERIKEIQQQLAEETVEKLRQEKLNKKLLLQISKSRNPKKRVSKSERAMVDSTEQPPETVDTDTGKGGSADAKPKRQRRKKADQDRVNREVLASVLDGAERVVDPPTVGNLAAAVVATVEAPNTDLPNPGDAAEPVESNVEKRPTLAKLEAFVRKRRTPKVVPAVPTTLPGEQPCAATVERREDAAELWQNTAPEWHVPSPQPTPPPPSPLANQATDVPNGAAGDAAEPLQSTAVAAKQKPFHLKRRTPKVVPVTPPTPVPGEEPCGVRPVERSKDTAEPWHNTALQWHVSSPPPPPPQPLANQAIAVPNGAAGEATELGQSTAEKRPAVAAKQKPFHRKRQTPKVVPAELWQQPLPPPPHPLANQAIDVPNGATGDATGPVQSAAEKRPAVAAKQKPFYRRRRTPKVVVVPVTSPTPVPDEQPCGVRAGSERRKHTAAELLPLPPPLAHQATDVPNDAAPTSCDADSIVEQPSGPDMPMRKGKKPNQRTAVVEKTRSSDPVVEHPLPQSTPVITLDSVDATRRAEPSAGSIQAVPSSLASSAPALIELKFDGVVEADLAYLPPLPGANAPVARPVRLEAGATDALGSSEPLTELEPLPAVSKRTAAAVDSEPPPTRTKAKPPAAVDGADRTPEPGDRLVSHKVETICPKTTVDDADEPVASASTEDECYVADEPIPRDEDDAYYSAKLEQADALLDGYIMDSGAEISIGKEEVTGQEEHCGELLAGETATVTPFPVCPTASWNLPQGAPLTVPDQGRQQLQPQPQQQQQQPATPGEKIEEAVALQAATAASDGDIDAEKEEDDDDDDDDDDGCGDGGGGFPLEDIDINSLVLVESQDPSKPNKTIYEIYVANPDTGQLSEKPLDVPPDVIKNIRAILEASDGSS